MAGIQYIVAGYVRVLFVISSFSFGGAQQQLFLLAKGLRKRGHDVDLVTYYPGARWREQLETVGVRIFSANKQGRWDIGGFISRLVSIIRAAKPDIIYSFTTGPNVLMTVLKPFLGRCKLVWGVRASNIDLANYHWTERAGFAISTILSFVPSAIVSNSNCGSEFHIKHGYKRDKVWTVLNGIDSEQFKFDPDGRESVRRELGVSGNEKLVGIVGRLDPMKGHEIFVEALSEITRARSDVKAVIIGEGDLRYTERVKEMARNLKLDEILCWSRFREDMPQVYSALDLLVSSSVYGEGFSNVVVEAMSCGTRCVVTDVGDSKEIVGKLGYVVPVCDAKILANAVRAILDGGATTVNRDVLFNYIGRRFSIETMVRETENILMRAIDPGN